MLTEETRKRTPLDVLNDFRGNDVYRIVDIGDGTRVSRTPSNIYFR